jgi:hypothetical protein
MGVGTGTSSMFPMREEKLDWQLIAALEPDTLSKSFFTFIH